jgi:hypothetical protein
LETLSKGKVILLVFGNVGGSPMRNFIIPALMLAGSVAGTQAFAQGTPQSQGGMMHQGPMMQGQDGTTQQAPTPQGQGGMMAGCPMMKRMAAVETRLRQLEERAGIPAPPSR